MSDFATRISSLERLVQKGRSPEPQAIVAGVRMQFLEKHAEVASWTDSKVSWTRFDATRFVPGSASSVILEGYCSTGNDEMVIEVRASSRMDGLKICAAEATGSQDQTASRCQAFCPLSGDGTFEYRVDGNAGSAFWFAGSLKIVGWCE